MFNSIYFGKISKEETERLLEKYGIEGSFLARDSESIPGAFCLCVRNASFVHTHRIHQSPNGWTIKTCPQMKMQSFQTLDELIDCCKGAASNKMAPLLHPLERKLLAQDSPNKGWLHEGQTEMGLQMVATGSSLFQVLCISYLTNH